METYKRPFVEPLAEITEFPEVESGEDVGTSAGAGTGWELDEL